MRMPPSQSPTPAEKNRALGVLRWPEVRILYAQEMRSAFREKTIVINSLLLPMLLYPFVLWLAFTAILFVRGQTEGLVSRVRVINWPQNHPGLRRVAELRKDIALTTTEEAPQDSERKVREGALDLVVRFEPAKQPLLPDLGTSSVGALTNNFSVTLVVNEARERSLKARNAVRDIVQDYRQNWLRREAANRGVTPSEWQQFTMSVLNVASGRQVGGFILGLLLPILFVVMVAAGCFFPAVDCTAGERERGTWETLMGTAASRASIVAAKYLYVASLGSLAGALNLAAMLITVKPLFAPLLAKAGEQIVFALPAAAIPVLLLSALLLAAFVAAGMMVFAAFARTFKEGQAMITPFYLIILTPLMFLQVPGLKFTVPLAFIPVVNVTMMLRAAVSGSFPPVQIAVTLVVSAVAVALALSVALYALRSEDVMVGSFNGSFAKFLKHRLANRKHESARGPA